MAPNLKSRLVRLKADQAAKAGREGPLGPGEASGAARPADRDREVEAFLRGWSRAAPFVFVRDLSRAIDFPESLEPRAFLSRRERPGPPRLAAASLRFFDLETTGLSGGTGTVAFLAAIGRLVDGHLHQRQVFMADYPGEGDFVALVLEALGLGESPGRGGAETALVTYNGRAFDLPLLRNRCVLCGLRLPEVLHLDVLHPSRRLWKSLHGGASLGLLEEAVLGIERGPDVAGALIPDLYFAYLRSGDPRPLREVVTHNAQDIHSLARLLSRSAAIIARPGRWKDRRDLDRRGLAAILAEAGRAGESRAVLEAAAMDGDEAAALLLVRSYARAGLHAERAEALGLLGSGAAAWVEKAKFHEHRSRDFARALEDTREALAATEADRRAGRLSPPSAQARLAALAHRETRLLGRLGRPGAP